MPLDWNILFIYSTNYFGKINVSKPKFIFRLTILQKKRKRKFSPTSTLKALEAYILISDVKISFYFVKRLGEVMFLESLQVLLRTFFTK